MLLSGLEIMNLLETSKKLSEEATTIERNIESLSLYIYSPRVRRIIFGYTPGQAKQDGLLYLIQRSNNLYKKVDHLLQGIEEYYNKARAREFFIPEKIPGVGKKIFT